MPNSPNRCGTRRSPRWSPRSTTTRPTLVIQVPSTLARDRILTRYQPLITDALAEIGRSDCRFDVITGRDRTRRPRVARPTTSRTEQTATSDSRRRPPRHRIADAGRRPRRRRAEPALHVRDVREGRVQPVRRSPPHSASPRPRRAATTRCSSTARPVSARPTCCTRSATTSTATTSTTSFATSRPRRS